MRAIRIFALAVLLAEVGLMLYAVRAQRLMSVAAVSTAAATTTSTDDARFRETVTGVADEPIPNLPGKRLVSRVVEYPPGGGTAPHRHARSAFIHAYVLSGAIRSQVDDGPARVYRAGETWFESPGAHHRVSVNASDTEPARLLAVLVVDEADKELTLPDHR